MWLKFLSKFLFHHCVRIILVFYFAEKCLFSFVTHYSQSARKNLWIELSIAVQINNMWMRFEFASGKKIGMEKKDWKPIYPNITISNNNSWLSGSSWPVTTSSFHLRFDSKSICSARRLKLHLSSIKRETKRRITEINYIIF